MPTRAKVWNGNDSLRRLLVRTEDLHAHPSNPRRGNVEVIQRSLERFGQQRPLLALPDGTIVAGNHTYRAAVESGWTHIAVVRSDLTDAEVDAYLVADNRTSDLGVYDDTQLAALLKRQYDDDTLLGTGYERDDVEELLTRLAWDGLGPREGADDPAPEPPEEPRSERGVVYELGSHRLMCGDSCDPDDVATLLDGATPILMLTDPPYGIELDMEWRDRAGHNELNPAEPSYMQRMDGLHNTTISGDTRADWSEAFALVPSLKIAYVWHASHHACEVKAGLERIGFVVAQTIIWDKTRFAMSRSHYHWQHEPCYYARKQGSRKWRGSMNQSTIWSAPSPKMIMAGTTETKVDHPTQKPVMVYTRPIENHLRAGEPFYEPFGGSGTGFIAAEQTGRVCLAMEIDPKYVDVIRQRYAAFTGQPEYAPQ
jgi:DNA modification methylase